MYPNREVFNESPLALVAAEIRFTEAARLRQEQTRDAVTIALEDYFPYAEPLQQTDFSISPPDLPQVRQRVGVVLKNAASTETLTIMAESITYETTSYTTFDDLSERVAAACDALMAAKVRAAVRRIGLRYIDEIRVPDPITDVRDWRRWIDHRLVSAVDVGSEEISARLAQGIITYDLGDGRGLNFRFAALDQGTVVVPQHLKKPSIDEEGPLFVLDFDGYRDFPSQQLVPLSSDLATTTLRDAHIPCGDAFQRAITDDARALFRGSRNSIEATSISGEPG